MLVPTKPIKRDTTTIYHYLIQLTGLLHLYSTNSCRPISVWWLVHSYQIIIWYASWILKLLEPQDMLYNDITPIPCIMDDICNTYVPYVSLCIRFLHVKCTSNSPAHINPPIHYMEHSHWSQSYVLLSPTRGFSSTTKWEKKHHSYD